jgi:hypothetical protein
VTSRRLTARAARAVIEGATLTRAPTWPTDRRWHVVAADSTVLVVIAPAYNGISRTGWQWWIAELGPSSNRDRRPTREQAAVAGLGAWERWATSRT